MDLLWIIENQRSEKSEMNTLEKIFKLTYQMISKSYNLYINRKLRTRGFQRDQNYQILIYILKVIHPESQCLNSDWKWIVLGETLNWGVKWSRNSTNFLFTESWWNKKYNEIKIRWLRIIIREISYFQNQQNFRLKLGKIEENYELKLKINDLKLIKTQITVR